MDANEMANCGCGAVMRVSLARPRCSSFITVMPLESFRWVGGVIKTINIEKAPKQNKKKTITIHIGSGALLANSEMTFLCPSELSAELFPGVHVRWKLSSQWAGRWRFFTSETVLLVSPNRDSH